MAGLSPLAWFDAWADAFSAGFAGAGGAARTSAILHAGAEGFTLRDRAGGRVFLPYTDDRAKAPDAMGPVILRLAPPDGIIRPLPVPDEARGALAEIAALNMARLAPIPAAQAAWAIGAVRRMDTQTIADVHIAAIARLHGLREAAIAKGFVIAAADVADAAAPDIAAQANLLARPGRPTRAPALILGALVAALLALAAFGWLARAPDAAARAQAAEIAAGPPLTALIGAAAGALPDDAALTRLVRDGARVRLEGEAANPEALLDLINGAGPFRDARLAAPPERAPGAATARFVIEAEQR